MRDPPDEKEPTTAGILARALDHFASIGISVERLIRDNHFSYKNSRDVAQVLAVRGAGHVFIKPHCPWHNGKVERFNKTLQ
ncbi:DDE-type integrase/transposase/recombinase [Schaalia hyovaginalis]|nr:DDE-type integrase/transposase/recombinase [Schaalia hyovaginalis]